MWAIEVENLCYTHSRGTPFEKAALQNVSVKIARGQTAAIIGPTGSGKSTLVQHFNGILAPQKGTVKILGRNAADKAVRTGLWRQVGLVFQYPEQQLFEETVYDDIAFAPKNLGLSKEEIKNRVYRALNDTGLPENILTRSPLSLSGGLKRRVAIAGVLALQPEILVLDEPTAGMDPVSKKQFLNTLKKLQQRNDITIIMVTHSMEDAARLADWVLVLDDGRAVLEGTTREVFKQAHKIISIGLDVPVEVKTMLKLRQRGIPVRSDVLGLDEAVKEIVKVKEQLKKPGG
ncbi:energy-coupling factor transport system ATP-binding protein [Desulfohalotomaculum tongense]|uniref:energy-coupling factor transporter ATPase n=1 Tax=Desulforadius tongensis TaxID=1216062 RepID=UPI001956C51A|nr:energy-coupling factor transporter ATPase [Desulforadius tongensis]MBM7853857.1 energy-coupling factor transport system ATP-binding protein [Desulforadius tongensis]